MRLLASLLRRLKSFRHIKQSIAPVHIHHIFTLIHIRSIADYINLRRSIYIANQFPAKTASIVVDCYYLDILDNFRIVDQRIDHRIYQWEQYDKYHYSQIADHCFYFRPKLTDNSMYKKSNSTSHNILISWHIHRIQQFAFQSLNQDHNKETVDTFSLPGTMFTEYHCYYAGKPSHAFFEACCPTMLLKIPARAYDDLISRSHEFARWCLSMAQCQLYTYEIRELNLSGSVRDRYMTLMDHRPDIIRQVSLRTIAAYLGVSPQYLSTLRTKWLMKGGKD